MHNTYALRKRLSQWASNIWSSTYYLLYSFLSIIAHLIDHQKVKGSNSHVTIPGSLQVSSYD